MVGGFPGERTRIPSEAELMALSWLRFLVEGRHGVLADDNFHRDRIGAQGLFQLGSHDAALCLDGSRNAQDRLVPTPVSYTHLTLPTKA